MTVDPGNELQTVTLTNCDGGTFTLTFQGQTTTGIAFDATNTTVKAALVALSNVASTDVDVTGSAGGPYGVTFKGVYVNTNVTQMTADGTSLTGSGHNIAVTTTAQGDRPVAEVCYIDVSVLNGVIANQEILIGQTPPAGSVLVSKHDYYAAA